MKLEDAVKKAKRVYVIGNGGSYANAMHICNDLLSVGVRAHTIDPATLTAFANDHGYQTALARWLRVVGERGDLLVALSGSGRSANIMHAVNCAEIIGMDVYRIYGKDRGEGMQEAEESQIRLGHEVMLSMREAACV